MKKGVSGRLLSSVVLIGACLAFLTGKDNIPSLVSWGKELFTEQTNVYHHENGLYSVQLPDSYVKRIAKKTLVNLPLNLRNYGYTEAFESGNQCEVKGWCDINVFIYEAESVAFSDKQWLDFTDHVISTHRHFIPSYDAESFYETRSIKLTGENNHKAFNLSYWYQEKEGMIFMIMARVPKHLPSFELKSFTWWPKLARQYIHEL